MVKWIGTAIAFGQGAAEIAWKGLKGTQWGGENVAGLDGDGGVYEHLHSCDLRLQHLRSVPFTAYKLKQGKIKTWKATHHFV